MARLFTAASNEIAAYTTGAILTSAPLTMVAWVRKDTLGATYQAFCLRDKDNADATRNTFAMRLFSDNTVHALCGEAGGSSFAATTATMSSATWHHCAVRFNSATSRYAFLDGVASAQNTTSRTPASIDSATLGAALTSGSTVIAPLNGAMAEAAIYNVALADSDIAMLAEGYSPLMVRPDALVAYWPVVGKNSPETDIVGAYDLTLTGTTASEHPRIIRPSAKILTFPSAVSSGTTVSVPKGSLVLTGYAPNVLATDHKTISVPKGALTLTGYAPTVTVSSGTTIFVPKASLTLTGYAPTVLIPQVVQVPKGGLVLTGYAPDVLTPVTVLVPKGTLTITGYAPTIVVTSNKLIEVPKGALVLRGYAPTVLGTVVAATNKGSYSEPDRKLRERLRKLALQQAYLEDDEEALAILLATIMREHR